MRPYPALLTLLFLAPTGAAVVEGAVLDRCARTITAAAAKLVTRHRDALQDCTAKAMRCPGGLSSDNTAASDRCLARVAARCRIRLAVSVAATRLEAVAERCAAEPAAFFDEDGLGFAAEAAFCPGLALRPETPADTVRCQRQALACMAAEATSRAAPRTAEVLTRLGLSPAEGEGCLLASLCGNGMLDGDEECDDGEWNSNARPDACRTDCTPPRCGDGVVDPDEGEDCDDGNLRDDDGCDDDCSIGELAPYCGDGDVGDDEECDDGIANSDVLPDRCRTNCTDPRCGDGVVDGDEECEPPGTVLCTRSCARRVLGPFGARTAASARASHPTASCQEAILRSAERVFERTRATLAGCVARVAHCLMAIPEAADPDGERSERCLERASRHCTGVAAAGAQLRAKARARAEASCGSVPPAQLLDSAGGLGFGPIARSCPAGDDDRAAVGALFGCVFGSVACTAERTVARSFPRAYALLDETDVDPDEVFPCLTDPDDVEMGSPAGAFIDPAR